MHRLKSAALAAAMTVALAGAAAAQTTPPTSPPMDTPPVATAPSNDPNAPLAGANSFTENQAKERIEKAGLTQVTDLKKDDQGHLAWTRHDGRQANRMSPWTIAATSSPSKEPRP